MKRDTAAMRAAIRREPKCRVCGSWHNLDAHHITPRGITQCDDPENLVVLCRRCHDDVHAKKVDLGVYLTAAEGAKAVLLNRTVHMAHQLLYPSEHPHPRVAA